MRTDIPLQLIQLLSPEQAWHFKAIPFAWKEEKLMTYLDDNDQQEEILENLELLLGVDVLPEYHEPAEIRKALTLHYRINKSVAENQQRNLQSLDQQQDALHNLISEAKSLNSSDIHLEPYEDVCRVRIRIDGILIERFTITKENYRPIVNKIKVSAKLDISEKRLPQDGRIKFQYSASEQFDLRVSTLPTLYGEKVVLRLLAKNAKAIQIEKLGFENEDLKKFLEGIQRKHGIILISGPTGSGKTTTLYGALQKLNKSSTNVITIEDPIEYTLKGINQVQLKENIGLDYPKALRTFLRQDPDVIMVGEIRDADTATMAIRAALTGHLVLSTIHTNSAFGIVMRLIELGVPQFLVADTLIMAIAQRLVRILCEDCKKEEKINIAQLADRVKKRKLPTSQFIPVGCHNCHFTGYLGRKAIYDILPIDQKIKNIIRENKHQFENLSVNETQEDSKDMYSGIADNAVKLLIRGETSLEEIYPILLSA